MENPQLFLSTTLFSEKGIISYRLLSRKLKIHVNKAKEILYDFYTTENARKPKCVHATYVITGLRKLSSPTEGGGKNEEGKDTDMGSPFDSSFPGTQTATGGEDEELSRVVELCQEEELDGGDPFALRWWEYRKFIFQRPGVWFGLASTVVRVLGLHDAAKAEFKKVLSVHVYSLEPVLLNDLSTLTACSADILEISLKEDPLKMGETYGTILNPSTKRASSRVPPVSESKPESKKTTLAVHDKKKEVIPKREVKTEQKYTKAKELVDEKEKQATIKTSTLPLKKPAPAASKPKRGQSNLFTSWGNAPKKSAETAPEVSSAAQSPKPEESDVRMESDGEEELEDQPSPPVRDQAEDIKKRKERDEELRKMMEDDEDEDIKMEDKEPPTKAEIESEADEPSGATANVASTGGRRRGKRKVMKKIQSRDEEGYLVTKTEAVWESFSEDEPEPPKSKPKAAAKGKRGGAAGQGNIMSFFVKK